MGQFGDNVLAKNQFYCKSLSHTSVKPWDLAIFDTPVQISKFLNTGMCKFESSQRMKAQPSQMIPRKPTENLELLIVDFYILLIYMYCDDNQLMDSLTYVGSFQRSEN